MLELHLWQQISLSMTVEHVKQLKHFDIHVMLTMALLSSRAFSGVKDCSIEQNRASIIEEGELYSLTVLKPKFNTPQISAELPSDTAAKFTFTFHCKTIAEKKFSKNSLIDIKIAAYIRETETEARNTHCGVEIYVHFWCISREKKHGEVNFVR